MVTRGARYGYLNAKLRTRLAQLLTLDGAVTGRAQARSLSEAVEALKDTPFAELDELYRRTGDIRSCELHLLEREMEEAARVEELLPQRERSFIAVFYERYDLENLKALLRLWYERNVRGRTIEAHIPYLCRRDFHFPIPFDDVLLDSSYPELAETLAGVPYAHAVNAAVAEAAERASVYPLELSLDRAYFLRCAAAAESLALSDRRRVRRVLALEIDRFNFVSAVRYRVLYGMGAERLSELLLSGGTLFPAERLQELTGSDQLLELLTERALSCYPRLAEYPEGTAPAHTPLPPGRAGRSAGSGGKAERLFRRLQRIEARRMLAGYPFTLGTAMAYSILVQQEIKNVSSLLNAVYFGADMSEAVTLP